MFAYVILFLYLCKINKERRITPYFTTFGL